MRTDDVAYAPFGVDVYNATTPQGCSSGYVTGTPIDYARCVVVELDLSGNNLTGELNLSAIGTNLPHLQVLRLDRNALSGTIAEELVTSVGHLHALNLSANRFDYTSTPEVVFSACWGGAFHGPSDEDSSMAGSAAAERVVNISGRLEAVIPPEPLRCFGMPSHSCTAFGEEYRVAADQARTCLQCSTVDAVGAAFFGVFLLPLACFAWVLLYASLLVQRPQRLTEWVTALSVLLYFSNTISILLRFDLSWPQSIVNTLSVLALDVSRAEWARPECLLGPLAVDDAALYFFVYKLLMRVLIPGGLLATHVVARFILDDGPIRACAASWRTYCAAHGLCWRAFCTSRAAVAALTKALVIRYRRTPSARGILRFMVAKSPPRPRLSRMLHMLLKPCSRSRRGVVSDEVTNEAADLSSSASLARLAAEKLSSISASTRFDALELLMRDASTLTHHECAIAECLDDSAWFVRRSALVAISRIDLPKVQALMYLLPRLHDESEEVREAAMYSLCKIDDGALREAQQLLAHSQQHLDGEQLLANSGESAGVGDWRARLKSTAPSRPCSKLERGRALAMLRLIGQHTATANGGLGAPGQSHEPISFATTGGLLTACYESVYGSEDAIATTISTAKLVALDAGQAAGQHKNTMTSTELGDSPTTRLTARVPMSKSAAANEHVTSSADSTFGPVPGQRYDAVVPLPRWGGNGADSHCDSSVATSECGDTIAPLPTRPRPPISEPEEFIYLALAPTGQGFSYHAEEGLRLQLGYDPEEPTFLALAPLSPKTPKGGIRRRPPSPPPSPPLPEQGDAGAGLELITSAPEPHEAPISVVPVTLLDPLAVPLEPQLVKMLLSVGAKGQISALVDALPQPPPKKVNVGVRLGLGPVQPHPVHLRITVVGKFGAQLAIDVVQGVRLSLTVSSPSQASLHSPTIDASFFDEAQVAGEIDWVSVSAETSLASADGVSSPRTPRAPTFCAKASLPLIYAVGGQQLSSAELADRLELHCSILFDALAVNLVSECLYLVFELARHQRTVANSNARTISIAGGIFAAVLLMFIGLLALHYWWAVQMLVWEPPPRRTRVTSRRSRWPRLLSVCTWCLSSPDHAENHAAPPSFAVDDRHPASCLAQNQRRSRLRYLVERFAPHAPRWQFVIWLRHAALLLVAQAAEIERLSYGFGAGTHSHPPTIRVRAAQAVAGAVIVYLCYHQHVRYQPWSSAQENMLDARLQLVSLLMIGCGALHTVVQHTVPGGTGAVEVFDALLALSLWVMLFGTFGRTLWHFLLAIGVPQWAHRAASEKRLEMKLRRFRWAHGRWKAQIMAPTSADYASDSDSQGDADDERSVDSMPRNVCGRVGARKRNVGLGLSLPGVEGHTDGHPTLRGLLQAGMGSVKLSHELNATPRGPTTGQPNRHHTHRSFTHRNTNTREVKARGTPRDGQTPHVPRTMRTQRINGQSKQDRALAVQDMADRARFMRQLDRDVDPRMAAAVERRRQFLVKRGIDPDSQNGGPTMPRAAGLPPPAKAVVKKIQTANKKLPSASCLPPPQMRERLTHVDDADENERGYSVAVPPRMSGNASSKDIGASAFIIPSALPRPGQFFKESDKEVVRVRESPPAMRLAMGPQQTTPDKAPSTPPLRLASKANATAPRRGSCTPRRAGRHNADGLLDGLSAVLPSVRGDEPPEPPIAARAGGARGRPSVSQQEQDGGAEAGGTRGVDPTLEC